MTFLFASMRAGGAAQFAQLIGGASAAADASPAAGASTTAFAGMSMAAAGASSAGVGTASAVGSSVAAGAAQAVGSSSASFVSGDGSNAVPSPGYATVSFGGSAVSEAATIAVPGASTASFSGSSTSSGGGGVVSPLTDAEWRELHTWLSELHRIHGLAAGSPLVVGQTSRVAGAINQTIEDVGGATVITRV